MSTIKLTITTSTVNIIAAACTMVKSLKAIALKTNEPNPGQSNIVSTTTAPPNKLETCIPKWAYGYYLQ